MLAVYLMMMEGERGEYREAFTQMYRSNYSYMYVAAKRILHDHALTEDAVHASFYKLLLKNELFDQYSQENLLRLCICVARNTAIDMLRRKRHESSFSYNENFIEEDFSIQEEEAAKNKQTVTEGPEQILGLNEDEHITLLKVGIKALPQDYRDALSLRYYLELPIDLIADAMSISMKTAEMKLYRGKKMLKEYMEAHLHEK